MVPQIGLMSSSLGKKLMGPLFLQGPLRLGPSGLHNSRSVSHNPNCPVHCLPGKDQTRL